MVSIDEEEEKQVSSEEEESGSGEDEEEEEMPVCRLSQPAHPHTLSRRTKINIPSICFACLDDDELEADDYYCTTCEVGFEELCYTRPRKMTHPYHPQHPLVESIPTTGFIYDCQWYQSKKITFEGVVGIPDLGNIFHNCTWCGMYLKRDTKFYRCSICNFSLCSYCSETFPLPTIQNPKSHHHSLIFLPRPLLLPCDACGVVQRSEPSYACFQCNYVVHKSCIDLPRVIKLTRHPHRLFYTPFLSPTLSLCPLCYKKVDVKYGHYSCNHDDCSYVAHSKCATHKKIWDGRELEWKPEESGEAEDVAPFTKVGDELIKYFCHDHLLKLDKYDGVRDKDKQCQACVLHIDSHDFYNCVQCDFFLHEVCANLPRKLDHALHNHPLFLDPAPSHVYVSARCGACSRDFSGFAYKCSKNNCDDDTGIEPGKFQVHVGCILVPDCFTHKSHEHPLFIPIPKSEAIWLSCKACKKIFSGICLKCTICPYLICYGCATIPEKLHNKYDVDVPLSLSYGEVSDEKYWCEVCEKKLDPSDWFYTCSKTNITIHKECVFGEFAFMKPGYTHYHYSSWVELIRNDGNTRPICCQCRKRCPSSVYFKWFDDVVHCSFSCFVNACLEM